ncbi:MAG: hypothetical protein APF76_14565 [Desulfitibacter sp. BRH_c19]|nr:MAG: hypothetical protein APF76_14565 [Desulfitibacter sp. BRH_c19]
MRQRNKSKFMEVNFKGEINAGGGGEMNGINEWLNAIGNVGFPIAIAIYLLMRFEKKIDVLKQRVDQLGQAIRDHTIGR